MNATLDEETNKKVSRPRRSEKSSERRFSNAKSVPWTLGAAVIQSAGLFGRHSSAQMKQFRVTPIFSDKRAVCAGLNNFAIFHDMYAV